LRAAIAATVGDPRAAIELEQWSRYPAPRGSIEFPRAGIADSRGPAVLWHGYVKYGTSRRFAIWARVRLSVPVARLVASENLPAGKIIRPDQLRAEIVACFPFDPRPAGSMEEAAGRVPRRSIPAGAAVWPGNLDAPLAIHAGDTVSVEVSSGQAQLAVEGRAAASGRLGDIIPVRNPASGKTFRARVMGPGKTAIVVPPPSPAQGLITAQGEKGAQ
jgi:flagella basal body P-ring formation protein FlgA